MKLETLQYSRYKELARRFKQLKNKLVALQPPPNQEASEEYKEQLAELYQLIEPELTEATTARMKRALVEHEELPQKMHDPVLHELRNPGTFAELDSVDIGLLFAAYGEYGSYQKTVALDHALSKVFTQCTVLYHRRHARQEAIQTGQAR